MSPSPSKAVISPDGGVGNAYGPAIWSMDRTTLQLTQRLKDDLSYGIYCPTISPDGNWLAHSNGLAYTDGVVGTITPRLAFLPVQPAIIDSTKLKVVMADSAGRRIVPQGRMAFH